MKSNLSVLLLLGGALTAWPTNAEAQGTLLFTTASVYISTNSVHSGPPTGLTWSSTVSSNAYYYALLVGPTDLLTVDTGLVGWTFTGDYATNTGAGTLNGKYTTDGAVIVPGYPAGSRANFVVVGWSANIGHDWGSISALVRDGSIGSRGFSAISEIGVGFTLAGGGTPPAPVLGLSTWQIPGFTLDAPVPEPGILPLLLLAGGLRFLFCREPRLTLPSAPQACDRRSRNGSHLNTTS